MKSNDFSAFLRERIDSFDFSPKEYTCGVVESIGDGVVHVSGLTGRKYGELLLFEGGAVGMAMELSETLVGAVLFDESEIKVGSAVRGTGAVAEVPVGEELLGRVIDPLGRPLDGLPLNATHFLPSERSAPAIIDRRPVDTPVETGILAIDSMIPIGRGQRELIIGDRQTGKTTIALDTIIHQKDKGVLCVYCAIGQKASTVAGVIDTLKKTGASEHTVVVSASASDSAALQYLAPYSACSVAEYFEQQGRDVIVVYDDLSKHAVAYRAMSLLLLRPPGREAFPGDIFYLHSRLLERSACLSKANGGGSITALPIVETMAGNISAYIPTNIISITDGQIYLETDLFHAGVRPAVNTGLSVSRVGRAAQYPAMKDVSGTLRIDLSRYRELAVFSSFGSDIDEATRRQLEKGETLVNLFVQGKNSPYSLFEEVALLMAYAADAFGGVSQEAFADTISSLLTFLGDKCSAIKESVERSGRMTEEEKASVKEAIAAFAAV